MECDKGFSASVLDRSTRDLYRWLLFTRSRKDGSDGCSAGVADTILSMPPMLWMGTACWSVVDLGVGMSLPVFCEHAMLVAFKASRPSTCNISCLGQKFDRMLSARYAESGCSPVLSTSWRQSWTQVAWSFVAKRLIQGGKGTNSKH